MKLQHLKKYLDNAKQRAKREKIPFDLTLQDLIEIATDECPIFHTPFIWGSAKLGKGKTTANTPQLDRIQPELGYVRGNIAFLSRKANKMKDDGTMQEHYDIADWIWNHIHAKEKPTTSVPTGHNRKGQDNTESGSIPSTGFRQDGNDFNHHSGAVHRIDIDHRPQASSGDSMGIRMPEMGASEPTSVFKDNGEPIRPYVWP